MRYNSYKKKHITLEEGEQFCKKCNGSGMLSRSNASYKKKVKLICNECLGEGKLDWVEKAVGKRIPPINLNIEKLNLKRVKGRELKGE